MRAAVIGDRVRFEAVGGSGDERQGVIEEVLPRRNRISRPARTGHHGDHSAPEQVVMANLDRLWVVVSLARPPLNRRFLDRILAAARWQDVPAGVVLNKVDLAEADDPGPLRELYGGLGYPVHICSAEDGSGLEGLREGLARAISAFVGLSGVGKSSLLAALEPGLELRVASVGERSGHGRHTTSHSRLYPLSGGGYLADTPGMREFGLWGMLQRDLAEGFVEIDERAGGCRFRDCLHRSEPDCAVRDDLGDGVDRERYANYLALLDELPADELERDGKR